MHLLNVIVLTGSLTLPSLAQSWSTCGGVADASTVTITETLPPITVTVNIAPQSSASFTDTVPTLPMNHGVAAPETSLDPTTTLTSFSTLTSILSLIEATTETVKSKQDSVPTTLASARPFTGLAPNGWTNSSMTTLITVKTSGSSVGLVHPTGFSPLPKMPIPTGAFMSSHIPVGTGYLVPRQVGAVVVATIAGQVVSWTNAYDGSMTTTVGAEAPARSPEPQVTLPVYPWNFNLPSPSISTASGAPTTVVGIYPWNLPPSSGSSTSSAAPMTVVGNYPWNLPAGLVPTTTSTTPAPAAKSSFLPIPSGEIQPGIPSVHPTSGLEPLQSSIMSMLSRSSAMSSSTPLVSATTTVSFISPVPRPSYARNATSTSGTAAAPQASCSSLSPFIIGFDDLPHFSIGNNPNDTDVPPIFNPYRKLYWENHFGYVPPPTDPFLPVSGKQLAVYRVDNNTNVDGSPDAGLELIGEFGAGPRYQDSAYWIDAFSVYLGCSNAGPSDCVIYINGYDAGHSIRVASQTVTQPPCPSLINCELAKITFNQEFRNLSGVQILATVDRRPVTWYMDQLELGWTNNTCAASTQRNSHQ